MYTPNLSNEYCLSLKFPDPLITSVQITFTSQSDGGVNRKKTANKRNMLQALV